MSQERRCFGSSPRLRGTPVECQRRHHRARFIPAPAGNTPSRSGPSSAPAVHPRACGEHFSVPTVRRHHGGSSPRLRGTRDGVERPDERTRFIPAPAGNTRPGSAGQTPVAVHPRACGEHTAAIDVPVRSPGSSPRLRGTRAGRADHAPPPRFIPAPAGNTAPRQRQDQRHAVHPRACGEHESSPGPLWPPPGSSPRLRGTRRGWAPVPRRHRFIPAPAGNTLARRKFARATAVHPRACGEHQDQRGSCWRPNGSSPRLRGTRPGGGFVHQRKRFIPAPAGNTLNHAPQHRSSAVHPRACGEHLVTTTFTTCTSGSSPRLRGTRRRGRGGRQPPRFIPAPAGNTMTCRY